MDNPHTNPETFWDHRYGESEAIWSGNVNTALAHVISELEPTPGTALDLGCGEGADAIWLAQQGWNVTGLDISTVAVQRARDAAKAQGIGDNQLQFEAADLTTWDSEKQFDLVTASFLQSPVEFDRSRVLRAAQDLVTVGGRLLVISHATFPERAKAEHEDADHETPHEPTTPDSELELLQLDQYRWIVEIAELRTREITGPDGEPSTLDDTVILAQRTGWE